MSDLEKWLEEKDESKWTAFPNYAQRAKEINESIIKEERDRQNRIDRAKKEEKTWELIRLCVEYLEEKCNTWKEGEEKRRKLEEKERLRQERKKKAAESKLSFKCGFLQKKISGFMKRLPENEKVKYEREEEKKKRKRMQEIKEILWKKPRPEGEMLLEHGEHQEQTPDIKKLEERAGNIEEIVERYEKEKIERIGRQKILVEGENLKRKQKRERLELKAKLEEKWALMRWLVRHIEENQDQWDLDREVRQNEPA